MHTPSAALRRLASFLLMCGALLCAGAARAQVAMDTRPASPNVGDYVTLNIAGVFPREDFWVTETRLWAINPKPGSSNEFVAEVDLYYHWAPLYDGPEVRTVFTTSVGLGQFERPGTVEVVLRAFPQGGIRAYYDPTQPVTHTFTVGGGTPACGNELLLGRGQSCNPSLAFGTYRFGERSAAVPVIIRNTGTDPIFFGPFEVNNADYGLTRRCGESLEPREACEVMVTFSPSITGASPGRLMIRWAHRQDAIPFNTSVVLLAGDSPVAAVAQVRSGSLVVEYHASSTDQYFATANENEMRLLDNTSSGWRRSGVTFHAEGDFLVCRFFGDPVGGPRGHFYTARVDQCEALRTQDDISPRGRNVYRFEGFAFTIGLPRLPFQDDRWRCAEGTRPIYQMKRPAGGGRDLGYRLVAGGRVDGGANGDDIVRNLLQAGWWYEGHVMCSGRPPEEAAQ
jgi:hypothetical protein